MIKPYYEEENIAIYNGDCLEVMREIEDKSIDLIVTDPPYNLNYAGRGKINNFDNFKNDKLEPNAYEIFLKQFTKEAFRLLKVNSAIYIYIDFRSYPLMYGIIQKYFELKNCIVWNKNVFGFGQYYRFKHEFCIFAIKGSHKLKSSNLSDVWSFKKDNTGTYKHPTQKPKSIVALPIENSSEPNDIILDPFLGSGTTARACKDLGRKCIGIEISKEYCDIAVRRLGQEVLSFK